jgi:hypothetical protein
MHRAAADAMAARFADKLWTRRIPQATHTEIASRFAQLDGASRRQWWINGHQIGMFDALPWHKSFHALKHDPVIDDLPGLFGSFAELFSARAILHDKFDGSRSGNWVGGDVLRQAMRQAEIQGTMRFYDFGGHADQPLDRSQVVHLPALAIQGRVISMSMPDPAPPNDPIDPQHGCRPGSRGRMLPGWFVCKDANGELRVHGPAAPDHGLLLPTGSMIDDEDFLFLPNHPV